MAPPSGPAKRKRPWTYGRVRAWVRRYVVGITTTWGRAFDLVFIGAVFVAVLALALESIEQYAVKYDAVFKLSEIFVGTIFVVEYAARIWAAGHKPRYLFSFWGVIDFLALLPFLFSGFGFAFLRAFRVLRIFAILKIGHYTKASQSLTDSLLQSRSKITVFLLAVVVLVVVLSFAMYTIEPETFHSVPEAMWWVIVTLTTVGYGDIVPQTLLGRALASLTMITAFGIIAVPTGIVAVEYGNVQSKRGRGVRCPRCARSRHPDDANYCATCGERLPELKEKERERR